MMPSKRQSLILEKIVRDYINFAEPIGSEFLDKKHNLPISPATIRLEMQKLTDDGYLFQPHTSAGRVPTDKGYRFFVDKLTKQKRGTAKDIFDFEGIFRKEREDIFKFADHLVKTLAETSSNFSLLHLLEEDLFWKEGWKGILKQPEFDKRDFIAEFNNLLEEFEKNIDELELDSEMKIFIGREIPFSRTKGFSIMVSKCSLPKGKKGIISILGPKRMAYDRNIGLINSLTKLLE